MRRRGGGARVAFAATARAAANLRGELVLAALFVNLGRVLRFNFFIRSLGFIYRAGHNCGGTPPLKGAKGSCALTPPMYF
jgi:hypothetical protein